MEKGFGRDQIERVARVYKCNQDASRALGITIRSFSRLCRKYDIESPFAKAQTPVARIPRRRFRGRLKQWYEG